MRNDFGRIFTKIGCAKKMSSSVYWDRLNWNYTYENSYREFEVNVCKSVARDVSACVCESARERV